MNLLKNLTGFQTGSEENRIVKALSLPIKVLLGAMLTLEIARLVITFDYSCVSKVYNPFGYVLNLVIALSMAAIFGFTVAGRRNAPLHWFTVVIANILILFPYIPTFGSMFPEKNFGLPLFMVYVYFILMLGITVIIAIYAWGLNQRNEKEKEESKRKGDEFDSFIKEHK